MIEEKRTNDQIIFDGQRAVESVLRECSEDRESECQLSEYDLAVLVRHYYRAYLDASDLWFWHGQTGGEWKIESWANYKLKDLCVLLGDKTDEMIKAVKLEKDAERRKWLSKSNEGLRLYQGLCDGTVEMDHWHNWNHKQIEQHYAEMG